MTDHRVTGNEDLISNSELKSILLNYTPGTDKDIETVEKGVQTFFLFNQTPRALTRPSGLKYLSRSEILSLEQRKAIKRGEYLEYQEGKPVRMEVLIRPPSLKGDQIDKILSSCVRTGIFSVLRYLRDRDAQVANMESGGQLKGFVTDHVIPPNLNPDDRTSLIQILGRLESLSFQSYLDVTVNLSELYRNRLIYWLSQSNEDLRGELEMELDKFEEAYEALDARGGRPVLVALRPDFHVILPSIYGLVRFEGDTIVELKTEPEHMLDAFTKVGLFLINHLDPDSVGTDKPQPLTLVKELSSHPSFLSEDAWPGGREFLEVFQNLIKMIDTLEMMRRESMVDFTGQIVLKQLNMKFEPVYLTETSFEPPGSVADKMSDQSELFAQVMKRLKKDPEVITVEDKKSTENGHFLIFKSNIIQAFIRNKSRRSFLHLLARDGGIDNGIYGMLLSMNGLPEELQEEQRDLTEAIADWEEELEKERKKREKRNKGIWRRMIDFFLSLFGIESSSGSKSEKPKKLPEAPVVKKDGRVKRRKLLIPPEVMKAVNHSERKNAGLIWLDDVVYALGSVKHTHDSVGDQLYYDRDNRFVEVRPLIKIKRLFIRKENHENHQWLDQQKDILLNRKDKPEEIEVLIQYINSQLSELEI